jgi:hypothetical protein
MSYTHYTASASCSVAEDFDLNEYVKSLVDFIGNHLDDLPDSIQWLGDYTHEELIETVKKYVRKSGGKILIELDSEESNYDSDLWDWLCDSIREDVMTSKLMVMNYSTNDSRNGVECGTSYYMKDGTFYGSDDIEAILESAIPELAQGE